MEITCLAIDKPSEHMTAQRLKMNVAERLKHPHIMAEMLKVSIAQSSVAQRDFLNGLETIASAAREMFEAEGLIHRVELGHKKVWSSVAGMPLCFIDGGVANIQSLGAEPIAIRVGSYTVVPGVTGEGREQFRMEKQLVAELFDLTSSASIFEDLYDNTSKLRDAARCCMELSAAVECIGRTPAPSFVFLHGALINPVSAYADEDFPAFSKNGLEILLPPEERNRTGRDATFVSVYLYLLEKLKKSSTNVVSVVERASISTLVARTWFDHLKRSPASPGAREMEEIKDRLREYRISDSLLFHAILDEGEFIAPITVDRNVPEKRPSFSADIIDRYPMPKVTYVGVGSFAQPLRVEFFDSLAASYGDCVRLIIHACRLMPNYSFPAGLDIVDKFAKIPNWMNRPIHTGMAVQLMRRALASDNPKIIEAAKRMLCGTKRDWLFRPTP
jgi:hypothetical protein